ncbi:hypothetical protein F66182_3276 [Fusarium sp. NRRL 66182]|nr:hypothetical protein F66182_3276 [Fusarium sp. NRRL 66182]
MSSLSSSVNSLTPTVSEGSVTSEASSIPSQDSSLLFDVPSHLRTKAAVLTGQHLATYTAASAQSKHLNDLMRAASLMAFISTNSLDEQSEEREILHQCFRDFSKTFLGGQDVHCVAATLTGGAQTTLIRDYLIAQSTLSLPDEPRPRSALLRLAQRGEAKIFTHFGGQGTPTNPFEEIRDMNQTYHSLIGRFLDVTAMTLLELSQHPDASGVLNGHVIDILGWLQTPEAIPNPSVLGAAPMSFPLIGLLQLLQYMITSKALGLTPLEMHRHISGTTGHSQGIIVAAVTAIAHDWSSFSCLSILALRLLFWIGIRAQVAASCCSTVSYHPDSTEELDEEGCPSFMLSIRGLHIERLNKEIAKVNVHLPDRAQVQVALINDPRDNVVVGGPPASLRGLVNRVRAISVKHGSNQAKVPFSRRKPECNMSFLPITAPFHTNYLKGVAESVLQHVGQLNMDAETLRIPLYHTRTGVNLMTQEGNLVPELVRMITEQTVDWPRSVAFESATHILAFGPGGTSGSGMLTAHIKEGSGVHVILADRLHGPSKGVGYQPDIYNTKDPGVFAASWESQFYPKAVSVCGKPMLSTKFSRLLNLPPLMVAGMTPTTTHPDFVATIMRAGFHAELAGGGYYAPGVMRKAIVDLSNLIPRGRGITINLIYANPRTFGWQLDLVTSLKSEGMPIDGLTIGAGVPSSEAAEKIMALGLRHVSFKPGTGAAIDEVLSIASSYPTSQIILQWTGGRAGGHHSTEDFHQPLLRSYARIRSHSNVTLVVGSGFGARDGDCSTSYLSGSWATAYSYPPMPVDGILLGTRVMTSREAHTSAEVKKVIFSSKGLPDNLWEETYGLGSDISTVISEMGEPIHMIATRGVKLWADLDARVFSKPKDQQLAILQAEKPRLIERLNQDFQKVWFGKDAEGNSVDLEQMTYAELLFRLVELLYVKRKGIWQWIDPSYSLLFASMARSVMERFAPGSRDHESMVREDFQDPRAVTRDLIALYPGTKICLLQACDADLFLHLCRRHDMKPVPFIPTLDKDFQTYFKKDSLWQSEDIEAVVNCDAGRVCILQGPVAVEHSRIEESVEEILSNISQGHLNALSSSSYPPTSQLLELEYLDLDCMSDSFQQEYHNNCAELVSSEKVIFQLPSSDTGADFPTQDQYLTLLGGKFPSWRKAVFSANNISYGNTWRQNPLQRILKPKPGQRIEITTSENEDRVVVIPQHTSGEGSAAETIEVSFDKKSTVRVKLSHLSVNGSLADLVLRFLYHPEIGGTGIISADVDDYINSIKRFYWKLWYGDQPYETSKTPRTEVQGPQVSIDLDRLRLFRHLLSDWEQGLSSRSSHGSGEAPIEYAFIMAWEAIMKPLFNLEMDLFSLVHLGNEFELVTGLGPVKEGDIISSTAKLTALVNQTSGVLAVVTASIHHKGEEVVRITSRFLYRGVHVQRSESFQTVSEAPWVVALETPKQVAILESKSWFALVDSGLQLLNRSIVFNLQQQMQNGETRYMGTATHNGEVMGEILELVGQGQESSVMSYLTRHGKLVAADVPLGAPIPILSGTENSLIIKSPISNHIYARQSGDYNPIHTSPVFAAYASLPAPITHGMHTASAVRKAFEDVITRNGNAHGSSIVYYHVSFSAMVLPGQSITISIKHTAMSRGMKVFAIEAKSLDEGTVVLTAKARVKPEQHAYVFTGQGSQRVGMGMDLKKTSKAAADIWKEADTFFVHNYGFSLSYVVEKDPPSLTVSFVGPKGRRVLRNYLAILERAANSKLSSSTVKSSSLYQALCTTPPPRSYTFEASGKLGILSATQFTQPAVTIMEVAQIAHLKSRGILPEGNDDRVSFAGHSLGEYGALSALGGGIMPIEKLAAITFERGMTMQMAVERDASGRSPFSMCAVNPAKIPGFDQAHLSKLVDVICYQTNWLLEIVNYNIEGLQYICAGDVRALACLTEALNRMAKGHPTLDLQDSSSSLVEECVATVRNMKDPSAYDRGPATVPLKLIDVPFHSKFLTQGIDACREFLRRQLSESDICVEALVKRWIPNVTGRPFGIAEADFKYMYQVTGSEPLQVILETMKGQSC